MVRAQEDVEDVDDIEDVEDLDDIDEADAGNFQDNVAAQSGSVTPEVLAALTQIRDNLRVTTIFPHALFGSTDRARTALALRPSGPDRVATVLP